MTRNIVLICLDSVRKDSFNRTASRIQNLSQKSFENCRAASSWSTPSHASMISGLLAHEHNVHTHSRSFRSLPVADTFFTDLTDYHKIGISANIFAGPSYNFDKYFDDFYRLKRGVRFPETTNQSSENDSTSFPISKLQVFDPKTAIKSLINSISESLNSRIDLFSRLFDQGAKPGLRLAHKKLQESEGSKFIFINLMEAHVPHFPTWYLDRKLYDVPWNWTSETKTVWELISEQYDYNYWDRRNQLYRATIDYLDRCIADFIQSIDESTTVIVTSDHGDNLGTEVDENLANHKSSLSEGLLHVPLHIINVPNICDQTKRYFSHLDMPKLIKGCRDRHIQDVTRDQTFAELCGMSAGPDPTDRYGYFDRAIRCGYDGERKVVWDSLYNCVRYNISKMEFCWQDYDDELSKPPLWARERFNTDIIEFKSDAMSKRNEVNIDTSVGKRLSELGYR